MTDFYLDALKGNDSASGSLTDPWATISRAVKESASAVTGSAPVVHLQPGTYTATNIALSKPLSLIALGAGVIVEPASGHSSWSLAQFGEFFVWHASATKLPAGKVIAQATWQAPGGARSRIPVWNPAAPLDTASRWAAAVLSPNNLHTRWGLYSTSTDLYLIPPADGSWSDPNSVRILTGWGASAFQINGPDITLSGIELPSHGSGIRLGSAAERAHIDGVFTDCCGTGISIIADINPIRYGHDHLIERSIFRDTGHCIKEGEDAPPPGQGIGWNLIKMRSFNLWTAANPLLVNKALTASETVGVYSSGGSLNSVVQDCTFDGTFDGDSHYEDGNRYDASADTNFTFRRCIYKNITDDSHDRSRDQNGVVYEDCIHRNVGSILSPAPLWGSVTMRRCTGTMIGEQVRIADGTGGRPSGSVVKYGSINPAQTQGQVAFEDCLFWSDTPSTQGICPDGGDGPIVPKMVLTRTTIRVPYIVLNWGANYPHPPDWLTMIDSTLATSSSRPLKVQKDLAGIVITRAEDVDARYYAPATGGWTYR
jgi:hypothetical protein